MNNDNIPKDEAIANRVEGGVRKFFERLGGALDFALRRPLNQQTRTDITALIPPLERAVEEHLRHEGARIIAPNLIEFRYDYETYQHLTVKRREYLERELRASVYEFIHNRRYATLGDVQVKVAYDMFTRKLTIKTAFPDENISATVTQSSSPAAAIEPPKRSAMAIMLKGRNFEISGKGQTRMTIGRSRDNALIIEDSTVSSVHAAFSALPTGTIYLTDLGSSNGTFVNGVQILMGDKAIVKSGDQLKFGEIEVTFDGDVSS